MIKNTSSGVLNSILIFVTLIFSTNLLAQQYIPISNQKNDFWKNVQFGGGIGVNLGNGYTDLSISPSAIYNFDQYFALGVGVQYTYIKQKYYYDSHLYGGSIIALFNPLEEIQLSAELEELRVNINSDIYESEFFWNTGLFLGAGYRTGNVTVGIRYNVMFNDSDRIYNEAFMPFVRVYF